MPLDLGLPPSKEWRVYLSLILYTYTVPEDTMYSTLYLGLPPSKEWRMFLLWRIVFNYVNIFIRNMCLANCGASEAVYPCNVEEKIHEYFRSKMRQYL